MDHGKHIRNFSIIAHIDHGKSTLADRFLEVTKTIEARKMKEQVLDSMELERERGITIKMQPVRMDYELGGEKYILNLIDTPGHIDFYYEVSRALKAVEGSILLVDATQGVQAQTLTTLGMAQKEGLMIIPVVSKVDSPLARVPEVKEEVAKLLGCSIDDVLETSGKTGEGVKELLEEVIKRVPPPAPEDETSQSEVAKNPFRSLVFDFQYSNHRGVIVYVRVFDGEVKKNDQLMFKVSGETLTALEVGVFSPQEMPKDTLGAGEIGYIVTGIKKPGIASVGDTVASVRDTKPAMGGYMQPEPVVWASLYPESQDDFPALRLALGRLKLSDSSFTYEEESSGALGRGFRCGFLGMLHLEIITERLRREFSLALIVTTPSITYEVTLKNGKKTIVYSPPFFPDEGNYTDVNEPWVSMTLITPPDYLGPVMQMLYQHEAEIGETNTFGDNRTSLTLMMPLREMMRNFFDELKSVTSGFASVSYEIKEMRHADVVRLDLLVADEVVPAFSRVVSRRRVQEEAEAAVKKLSENLPRQMFTTKVQGKALGRILSSETLSAMKKDVTGYLYGGDITRKMKLRDKQKEGKKRMKERGKVNIPHDVFLKMMRSE
jgi:GTP-binding protein LepA